MRHRLIAISAAAMFAASPALAQAPREVCPGLKSVIATAGSAGLASLGMGWKEGRLYASAAKPAGMETAQDCSVVKGSGPGGRDQFDCLWTYTDQQGAGAPKLTATVKACLASDGWKADPSAQEHGANIVRVTRAGTAVEILSIEVDKTGGAHSARLSVSAPVK
jgi:hypothetical protein